MATLNVKSNERKVTKKSSTRPSRWKTVMVGLGYRRESDRATRTSMCVSGKSRHLAALLAFQISSPQPARPMDVRATRAES